MRGNLTDEEKLREASELTEDEMGIEFLLKRFGEDFVNRAIEYRKRKNNKRIN